jgi:ureidoglycolate hydrolase
MEIKSYEFGEAGLSRVYENEKWMVGIKNWKPANDHANIECLERHNETDELFVLVSGRCVLLFADEKDGELEIGATVMEPMKVYNIPRSLWHNTVTMKDTKLILIEDSSTSSKNSDVLTLDAGQIAEAKALSLLRA